jgi:uncharacterized protein YicC (UPF0701 family)
METDLLASFIGNKLAVLEQLRDLSRRQTEIVAQGDMPNLLQVLAVKQNLILELQAVEKRIDPFRDQDPDSRIWRSPEDRHRCRLVSQRCDAMLKEVMLIEKQCETALQQRRDECANRLQDLHRGSHAHAAYADSHAHVAHQLDLTSG